MIIILQNFDVLPLSINVPMNELDAIQEWLTDCSATYTACLPRVTCLVTFNLEY